MSVSVITINSANTWTSVSAITNCDFKQLSDDSDFGEYLIQYTTPAVTDNGISLSLDYVNIRNVNSILWLRAPVILTKFNFINY